MPSIDRYWTINCRRTPALPLVLNNQSDQPPYDAVSITFEHYRYVQHTIAEAATQARQTVAEYSCLRAEDTFLVPRHLLLDITTYKTLMTDLLSKYLSPEYACTMAGNIHDKMIQYSQNFSMLHNIVLRLKDVVNIIYVTSEDDEIIAWVLRQVAEEEDDHHQPFNFIPATKSAIEGLEKVVVSLAEMEKQSWSCVICMEAGFECDHGGDGGQLLLRLPCLHLFHGPCIVRWLETNHFCPLCRYAMPNVLHQSNFKMAN